MSESRQHVGRPATTPEDDASAPTDPTRVLVVDDEPDVCEVVQNTLEYRGYQVTTCSDSTKVMDILNEHTFECVLLDLHMPGLEGTELLPIIKHRFPGLQVIIVSGYVDPTNQNYCNSLGAFEIVTKPFSNDLLVDVINRAVGVSENIPFVLESLKLSDARDRVYRKLIVTALRRANWNQVKAAKLLGVSRYCLIRWLRKLEINY